MAEEPSTRVRSMVEKLLEADMADQISQRSREIAEAVSQATDNVTHRAEEAWKDSAPQRREAEKAARHAARDAMRWGRRTWQHDIRPELRKLWKQRRAAIAAAGAAIPAGREVVEDAAARAGIRPRRERHWGAFFLGILIGAAVGAVIAILTTPKPGRQMRDDLAEKARDAAEKAREAAEGAEWMPLFQREEEENGGSATINPPPTRSTRSETRRPKPSSTTPTEPAEPSDTAASPSVDAGPPEGEEQS
jgi:gas vesicle protein